MKNALDNSKNICSIFLLQWYLIALFTITRYHALESEPTFFCNVDETPSGRSNLLNGALWPNKIVYYQFEFNPTQAEITEFESAVADFHDNTCVRIVPRSNQRGYLRVTYNPSNVSICGLATVCYSGNPQSLAFGGKCFDKRAIVHELLHSLCFIHEQTRSDRDEYISYPGCPSSRIPAVVSNQRNSGGLYDYVSSTHYDCIGGCWGTPLMERIPKCGGDELSVLDIDKVNHVYGCTLACQRHRWYRIEDLTYDKALNLVNFAKPGEDSPEYVCRGYAGDGEISAGLYLPETRECQLNAIFGAEPILIVHREFQVLTIPGGPYRLTNETIGYRLRHVSEQNIWERDVPVGRGKYSNKAFLAVTWINGQIYIGKVYDYLMSEGVFTYQDKDYITNDFHVMACS